MSTRFVPCIRKAMKPLEEVFRFQIAAEAEEPMSAEVLYLNESTGLRVALDWRDFRPFVTLYRLQDGGMPPERPTSLAPGAPLHAFDADDLLLLRGASGPVGKMLSQRDTDAAGRLLREYATALEQHAADVLRGDFSVFQELAAVVRRRYEDLRRD
jgi:hypothetical protein